MNPNSFSKTWKLWLHFYLNLMYNFSLNPLKNPSLANLNDNYLQELNLFHYLRGITQFTIFLPSLAILMALLRLIHLLQYKSLVRLDEISFFVGLGFIQNKKMNFRGFSDFENSYFFEFIGYLIYRNFLKLFFWNILI